MCRNYFAPDRSDDPTVRARARGRWITAYLARNLTSGMLTEDAQTAIAGGDREAWALHVEPSGGWREPLPSYRQAAIAEREERLARIAAVYPAAAAEARQAGRE